MAAGATYTPIASVTTSSSATDVTFSSIPSTYTDLIIVMNFSLNANNEIYIRFNGDTGGNYSRTYMEGNGTSASSARSTNGGAINILGRSTQMVNLIQIMNYANTTTYKSLLARFNSAAEIVGTEVGLWRSTSAINEVKLYLSPGNYTNGSIITLYGIVAA